MSDLKTAVDDGQEYVDEPIVQIVPVYCTKEPRFQSQVVGHEHIRLRWMKPVYDKDGNVMLIPRDENKSK